MEKTKSSPFGTALVVFCGCGGGKSILRADGNAAFGQIGLHLCDCVRAEMSDGSDEDGIGMARAFEREFLADESCGKCTPCRLGAQRGVEVIDTLISGEKRDESYDLLVELCDTMEDASLCAMGGLTPFPVRSALKHFHGDFNR